MVRLQRQILTAFCLFPIACNDARQTLLGVVSPLATVRRYCGKDLSGMREDERQSLKEAVERMRSRDEPNRRSRDFEPQYVWEYGSAPDAPGCLVLESEPSILENETTSIRLIWLDHS